VNGYIINEWMRIIAMAGDQPFSPVIAEAARLSLQNITGDRTVCLGRTACLKAPKNIHFSTLLVHSLTNC